MDLPILPRAFRAATGEDAAHFSGRAFACGVGDGHPVIPVTEQSVELMLAGYRHDEPLGSLAPLWREATVEDVAVCAVMTGCPRAAMPVLVAAVRAVQHEEFNLLGVTSTTGSVAIGAVLHGHIASDVGANAGGNCLGPGNVANASIGRALATVVRAVGAAMPGKIDMAIMGQPAKYGMCFAEQPAVAGWPTLNEERRVPSRPGAVTVMGVSGTLEVVDVTSQAVTDLVDTLAGALVLPVGTSGDGHTIGSGEPVVVLPPEWVMRLVQAGWTKGAVRQRLWERAQVPLDALPPGVRNRVDAEATSSGVLRVARTPADLTLLVAGGPGSKATLLPLWPGGSRSVTVPVEELPPHP